jgi:hypothetical protein
LESDEFRDLVSSEVELIEVKEHIILGKLGLEKTYTRRRK